METVGAWQRVCLGKWVSKRRDWFFEQGKIAQWAAFRRYSSGWRAMPAGSRPASSQPKPAAASGIPARITSRLVTGMLVSDDRPSSELRRQQQASQRRHDRGLRDGLRRPGGGEIGGDDREGHIAGAAGERTRSVRRWRCPRYTRQMSAMVITTMTPVGDHGAGAGSAAPPTPRSPSAQPPDPHPAERRRSHRRSPGPMPGSQEEPSHGLFHDRGQFAANSARNGPRSCSAPGAGGSPGSGEVPVCQKSSRYVHSAGWSPAESYFRAGQVDRGCLGGHSAMRAALPISARCRRP